jgi:hypothetical protein
MIDVRNISIEFPFFFSFTGFLKWKFAMTEKAEIEQRYSLPCGP